MMKYFIIIRSALAFASVAFVLLTGTPIVLVLSIISFRKLDSFAVKWLGGIGGLSALKILGIKLIVNGREHLLKEPPVVYTMNHGSTLDIPVVLGLRFSNVRFVAKQAFKYNPIFALVSIITGQIFVDRGNSEKAIRSLHKAYERLQKNRLNVMIAPEGSRAHDGIIGPFKKGAFRMTIDLKRPLQPVIIKGVQELAPAKSKLFYPGTVTVDILPAIDTSGWSYDTINEHVKEVRSIYLKAFGIND